MNTYKIRNLFVACCFCCGLTMATVACDNELDIVPKGMTTLEKVDDLESLLNQEYSLSINPISDLCVICNESLGFFINVPSTLSKKQTLEYAYMALDDQLDRVSLTTEDKRYEAAYKYINYMNVIISKMPDAIGDDSKKVQLVAEARIIRAYLHWLLVNIHAKQYDDNTAATEGGIAYVDDTNVGLTKEKLSLAETYKRILEDCSDEVIALLPERNNDVERPDQAFGNGMRAMVLMQMKHYADALPYALTSLNLNGTIEDRSEIKESMTWGIEEKAQNNLLYIGTSLRANPLFEMLSRESSVMFEDNDYVIKYDISGGWSLFWGEMDSGIEGTLEYNGWKAQCNAYGLTSDRMHYTAAECYIRTGKIKEGLELVDRVRAKRIENYEPFAKDGLSEQTAMALMQKAKWMECLGSFINFFDCKRWNSEANYRRTITRDLCQYGTFTLSPESPLWVLPFPLTATRYNTTLTQNY